MKTKSLLLAIILPAVMMVGCAEEKKKPSSSNNTVVVAPDTCNPAVEDCSTVVNPCLTTDCTAVAGTAVTVTNVTLTNFRKLAKNNQLTTVPTDFKFAMDVSKYGQGFAGDMAVSFTYNNIKYTYGATTMVSNPNSDSAITSDARYNVQFPNKTWHGFFDGRGVRDFVIVVDAIEGGEEGDGAPLTGRGSVYFRIVPNNPEYCANPYPGMSYNDWYVSCGAAAISPSPCWNVSLGPRDCRTWKSGNGVNTFAALHPGAEYTKLGDFSGLNLSTSFNGDFAF
jgi:hypothetical protein